MSLTGSLIEGNGVGCFSSISYLRYAVSVHKHALEAVVNADVIQNRDDDLAIALHTLGGGETNNSNFDSIEYFWLSKTSNY